MDYYPPTGFYFKVAIIGAPDNEENAFQEVSGITTAINVEKIKEGGENRFQHKVPGRTTNLVLKRGIIEMNSEFASWIQQTLSGDLSNKIVPKDLVISLYDSKGSILMSWFFIKAYPIKWEINTATQENNLIIESLDFGYKYFTKNPI
jgi:phage tail-like protein